MGDREPACVFRCFACLPLRCCMEGRTWLERAKDAVRLRGGSPCDRRGDDSGTLADWRQRERAASSDRSGRQQRCTWKNPSDRLRPQVIGPVWPEQPSAQFGTGQVGLDVVCAGGNSRLGRRCPGAARHSVGTRYLDFSNDGVRDGDTDCMGCGLVATPYVTPPLSRPHPGEVGPPVYLWGMCSRTPVLGAVISSVPQSYCTQSGQSLNSLGARRAACSPCHNLYPTSQPSSSPSLFLQRV